MFYCNLCTSTTTTDEFKPKLQRFKKVKNTIFWRSGEVTKFILRQSVDDSNERFGGSVKDRLKFCRQNIVYEQCDHIGQFIALWANFSKSAATIIQPKSPTFLDNFCIGVKIFLFLVQSFWGNFYRHTVYQFESCASLSSRNVHLKYEN